MTFVLLDAIQLPVSYSLWWSTFVYNSNMWHILLHSSLQKALHCICNWARIAWLIGFCIENGFFQVNSPELERLYIDSVHTKIFHFNGNHKSTSPNDTGSTIVNIYAIRYLFDVISNYHGPSHHHDSPRLSSFFGFVVLVIETKAWKVFMSHCNMIQRFINGCAWELGQAGYK